MESIRYVDPQVAREARGVRLIVSGILPSPWSEAAKAIFHVARVPVLGVRWRRGDDELRSWTGAHNLPVVLYDDEPPRTGWAEILALAERLGGGGWSLVPPDPERRVRHHGLVHELAAEGGVGWCSRLVMLDGSLASQGARSFPLPVARYLAGKYGYSPERAQAARRRVVEGLALCDAQLARSQAAGGRYMMGEEPSALDLFVATFLTTMLFDEGACPMMRPELRPAFAYLTEQLASDVPSALAAHRAFLFREHLPYPIPL